MQPTDASDAHLADRAIEIRVLKSAVVVFVVTFATFFYPVAAVFAVFALAYVAYTFRYYRDRIGAFERDDRSIRHPKLELGLLGIGLAAVAVLVATRTVFPERWTVGGFLSLPPIDFTDLDALVAEPLVPAAWGLALAPAVAAAYAGFQLRHRLLAGLDSDGAAIRATAWASAARLPVYLLWVGVLSARPVFDVYEPVVRLLADTTGLAVGTTDEFAAVLGETFTAVLVVGLVGPATVIGTYVVGQRWKYDDATIPEVFGYHGIAPPSRSSHRANVVVPVGVYLLYVVALFLALGSLPIGNIGLAFGVVVSVLIGANVLGKTTILVRSIAEPVADNVNAVVTGLGVGVAALWVFDLLVGSTGSFTSLALTYPIVAIPLTGLANRVAGTHAAGNIARFLDGIDPDADSLDREAVDRLFVYSRAWDDTLRATATDGLARLVGITTYRRDDALDVFVRAVESDRDDIVRSGLRGIAAILARDRTAETYERLVDAGCRDRAADHLDSSDAVTRARATEAAARLYAFGLSSSAPAPDDYPTDSRIEAMIDVVGEDPDDERLAGAVVEYFSATWYASVHSDEAGLEPTAEAAQAVLGAILRLSDHVDEGDRMRAVLAVTSGRIPTDGERFSRAIDHLDGDREEGRFLATHVVRSSMNRRTDRIDTDRLLGLLEDPAAPVRRAGARSIATFVRLDPEGGSRLLDRLVLHLQEQEASPGLTEASVVRSLGGLDAPRLIEHPTAAETLAGFVDGAPGTVAEPAAAVLSSLVQSDPALAGDDAVGTAIESGLTHPGFDVRLHCLEAAIAVVDHSVENGRRFVSGLGSNLDAGRKHSGLSAVCLAELLDAFPEEGLEIVPELSSGLGNLTSVHRQSVPFVVRGSTVSAVVVDILTAVVPLDPGRCEPLIGPLTDFATSTEGTTLEGVFEVLAELSTEYPAECRSAAGTAAAVVEDGRPELRRDASAVLANVASVQPGAVEPFADRLIAVTDDDNPRVRKVALQALTNVCAATPTAIEDETHRIVGLLDDDSATVREEAARLILAIAEREPAVVEQAAETADRLRRLQRDPAVDVDAERLQDASTGIQTGSPIEGSDATDAESEELWTPESADEMGASGDTNVFEPGSEGFDAPEAGKPDVSNAETAPEPNSDAGPSGEDSAADVDERSTVVEGEESEAATDAADDVADLDTAVAPSETPPDAAGSSEVSDGEADESVEDLDTAMEPSGDAANEATGDDVEGLETAIGAGEGDAGSEDAGAGEAAESGDDVEGLETAIEPTEGVSGADEAGEGDVGSEDAGTEDADSEDAGSEDAGAGEGAESGDGVEGLETAIEPTEEVSRGGGGGGDASGSEDGGAGEAAESGDDVEGLETAIEPTDDGAGEANAGAADDDVEDLDTVIDPDAEESNADGSDGSDDATGDASEEDPTDGA